MSKPKKTSICVARALVGRGHYLYNQRAADKTVSDPKTTTIMIFGLVGVGKSELIKRLPTLLKKETEIQYDHYSAGSYVRMLANELGQTVPDIEQLAQKTDSIDKVGDNMVIKNAMEGYVVIDSRLGHILCPDAFKVKLECPYTVRLQRVMKRERMNLQEAMEFIRLREWAVKERFRKLYGLRFDTDVYSDKHFNLVLETTKPAQELAEALVEKYIDRFDGLHNLKEMYAVRPPKHHKIPVVIPPGIAPPRTLQRARA